MNKSTILQFVLLIILIACLAACNDKNRSSTDNTPLSPKESPDAEYPGTKEYDSIKKANPDETLEAKGAPGHPKPH